jgi:hypothetical protein
VEWGVTFSILYILFSILDRLIKNKISLFLISIFSFWFLASGVLAAEVYFISDLDEVYVGDDFLVEVRLDTEGEVINAGEVGIIFDKKVTALDVSDGSSAFNIFVTRPIILKEESKVFFAGGASVPFSGDVLLARVIFRAKAPGDISVVLSDDSRFVLGDGKGTVANLVSRELDLKVLTDRPVGLPVVFSSTHSDQSRFYNNSQAVIQWDREIGYRYSFILAKGEKEEPDDTPEEEINSTLFTDLEDGIYWFGIKTIDRHNSMGPVTFFRFMIDTTPPENLKASFNQDNLGRVLVALASTDKTSGIDYYEIETPEGIFEQADSNLLTIDKFVAITVKVFDKAGNILEKEIVLGVEDRIGAWFKVLAGVFILFLITFLLARKFFDKKSPLRVS